MLGELVLKPISQKREHQEEYRSGSIAIGLSEHIRTHWALFLAKERRALKPNKQLQQRRGQKQDCSGPPDTRI